MIARAASPSSDGLTAGAPKALESNLLGRFQLKGALGGTPDSRVHAALDTATGTPVAIKFGRARRASDGRIESEEEIFASLQHEAEVLRQLDGVGVSRFREVHEHPPCLVLDRIDGVDLDRFLAAQGQRLGPDAIATLCERLAEIVMTIHARGYLHGDIKPSNIMVTEDGTPVLVDLGAARRLIEADAKGDRSATPGYAPPEFHRVDRAIGPWSDVYSLGAVAYRIVTGRAPVPAEARLGGAAMISAVDAVGPGIPGGFAAAIDWALELEPAERPFSAAEWRQSILLTRGDTTAEPGTIKVRRRSVAEVAPSARPSEMSARPRRRWRTAIIATGVIASAALAAVPLLGPEILALYQSRYKYEWLVDAGGHGDAATISAALSRAPDGAKIRIRPGRYAESLTITRPVELIGVVENGEQPNVIVADGSCATVTAASAQISRISLRAEGADRNGAACVEIVAGRTSIDRAQIATASGPALAVRNGAELNLTESSVSGGGVLVAGSARATISGGEVRGTERSGIVVRGGGGLQLSGTSITGAHEAGLLLAEGATARVDKATIAESGTSGIEMSGGASGAITDSTVSGSAQAGVFVLEGSKAVVERTQITGSGLSGLIAAATAQTKVDGSTFEQNHEHGVLVLDAASGSVANSRMTGNAGHGIAIERSANVDLTDNVAERNSEPQIFDGRRPDTNADRRRGGAS